VSKPNLRDLLIPNIRKREETDEELRASDLYECMKAFGFSDEFPILADEDGMVMVGHRRERAAKLLSVKPVIKTLTLGKGEKADAERVKLALISNIGHAPMTPKDRKRIAEHLYGKDWSMAAIAEALNVSTATVGRDLEGFSHDEKTSRPKGGRPKGSKSKAKLPVPPPRTTQPAPTSAPAPEPTPPKPEALGPRFAAAEPTSEPTEAEKTAELDRIAMRYAEGAKVYAALFKPPVITAKHFQAAREAADAWHAVAEAMRPCEPPKESGAPEQASEAPPKECAQCGRAIKPPDLVVAPDGKPVHKWCERFWNRDHGGVHYGASAVPPPVPPKMASNPLQSRDCAVVPGEER
jgi:hypothetical protein